MGYTHYHTRNANNKGSAYMFGKLALDAKAIIAEAQSQGIVIRGYDGTGKPEFTEAYFRFNGDADAGLDHETFAWEALPDQPEWQRKHYEAEGKNPYQIFDFCKTAYKPYDAVVTAILIRAKVIYGNLVEVRSDGVWDKQEKWGEYGHWGAGRKLYETVFGEEAPNPFAGELVLR